MNAASTWPAWTDIAVYRPRYSMSERRVLKALAMAQAEVGRRPRLAEIEAMMPPWQRDRTSRILERLVRRSRVARGVFDAMSYRDTQEWRRAKRWH